MSDPTEGPTSVTLDEVEQMGIETQKPDLTKVTIEGDEVPEIFRGKSVAEAIKLASSFAESLKISEQARLQAEASTRSLMQSQPQSQAPPISEEPKELTQTELQELYDTNPLAAIETMQQQAIHRAERNLEQRLGPMISGNAATVESNARMKYVDEFELFGEEITRIASGIPNGRSVLANPAAWDDIISLVRGRPTNFERLMERKVAKQQPNPRVQAQREQQETVGFTEAVPTRRPIPKSVAQLDATQREIAQNLNMSEADYVKWSQIT